MCFTLKINSFTLLRPEILFYFLKIVTDAKEKLSAALKA